MFGGFTEGLQLFACFAMLMNFPRFNKMKGMGQIVSLVGARREPALRRHHQAVPRLRAGKPRDLTKAVQHDISSPAQTIVGLEDAFIDLAFETGRRSRHDRRAISRSTSATSPTGACASSACRRSTHGRKNPLPWLDPMLNGVEHANFFETRATEYSKAATRGTWEEAFS